MEQDNDAWFINLTNSELVAIQAKRDFTHYTAVE